MDHDHPQTRGTINAEVCDAMARAFALIAVRNLVRDPVSYFTLGEDFDMVYVEESSTYEEFVNEVYRQEAFLACGLVDSVDSARRFQGVLDDMIDENPPPLYTYFRDRLFHWAREIGKAHKGKTANDLG